MINSNILLIMQYDVFITYNAKDKKLAETICMNFESNGIKCFLGCRDIPTGQVLSTASLRAVEESRMLLVIYSQNYSTTPQINREIEKATKRDIPVLTVGQENGEELQKETERYIGWIKKLIFTNNLLASEVTTQQPEPQSNVHDNNGEAYTAGSNLEQSATPIKVNEPTHEDSYGYSSYVAPATENDYTSSHDEEITPTEIKDEAPLLTEKKDTEETITPEDCYLKAEAYYYGNGVRQSYYEAVKWYTQAAEMGHADAQCDLGNCYYYGEGLPENYERSVYWYEKAAEQGNVRALYNLGNSYYYGEGVTRNVDTAIAYYDRAADLGSVQAEERLEEIGAHR